MNNLIILFTGIILLMFVGVICLAWIYISNKYLFDYVKTRKDCTDEILSYVKTHSNNYEVIAWIKDHEELIKNYILDKEGE